VTELPVLAPRAALPHASRRVPLTVAAIHPLVAAIAEVYGPWMTSAALRGIKLHAASSSASTSLHWATTST
jgi:hypothetical protein